MQIFRVGKIKLFRGIDPLFQIGAVDTANALRIRVFFEDVLLKLLKEQRIIVIILEKRLTLVHGILPGRVKNLCRSLLRGTRNPQLLPERSRNLLQLMRMAARLVAILAATSPRDSELPHRSIIASRTLGGASARILSASIAASTATIGVWDDHASEAVEKSMKTNCLRSLRRRPTSCLLKRDGMIVDPALKIAAFGE
jgi:hypothetical protein